MAKAIITISGRKGSGKDTFAQMVAAALWNIQHPGNYYRMFVGDDGFLRCYPSMKGCADSWIVDLRHGIGQEDKIAAFGCRIVSFATPLKQFCMDVLGLTKEGCYGTNEQKEQRCWVKWDGLPLWVRWKYRKGAFNNPRWWQLGTYCPRSGYMTNREVMQVFGTDVIRVWHPDGWAIAGYKFAERCQEVVVFIPDARFPNELDRKDVLGSDETVTLQVRLLRNTHPEDRHPSETALNNYNLNKFSLVLPECATLLDMRREAEALAQRVHSFVGTIGTDQKAA